MIASVLTLSRTDCQILRISDAYSIHRVVYDLFPDIRSDIDKQSSVPSGILFVDKGGDFHTRNILILSNRPPNDPRVGELVQKQVPEQFLSHAAYGFEVRLNPTKRDKASGKTIAIRGDKAKQQSDQQALMDWFFDPEREKNRGFTVERESLQIHDIGVQRFEKEAGKTVLHARATFIGKLWVTDRQAFVQSFQEGLGRAKAFGFGLLQIVPIRIQEAHI